VVEKKGSSEGVVDGGAQDESSTPDTSKEKVVSEKDFRAMQSLKDREVAQERKAREAAELEVSSLRRDVDDLKTLVESFMDPEKMVEYKQARTEAELQRYKQAETHRREVQEAIGFFAEKGVPRDVLASAQSATDVTTLSTAWYQEQLDAAKKAREADEVQEAPQVPIGSAPAGDVGVAIADELSEVKTEIQNGINAGMNDRQLAPLRQKYYRLKAEQQGGKRRKTSKV
jgi:hypothetical protein